MGCIKRYVLTCCTGRPVQETSIGQVYKKKTNDFCTGGLYRICAWCVTTLLYKRYVQKSMKIHWKLMKIHQKSMETHRWKSIEKSIENQWKSIKNQWKSHEDPSKINENSLKIYWNSLKIVGNSLKIDLLQCT